MAESYVYAIDNNNGAIKLGLSHNPPLRLASLQTGSPTRLSLLAFRPGTALDEQALHERFGHLRLHGEWFSSMEGSIYREVENWSAQYRGTERALRGLRQRQMADDVATLNNLMADEGLEEGSVEAFLINAFLETTRPYRDIDGDAIRFSNGFFEARPGLLMTVLTLIVDDASRFLGTLTYQRDGAEEMGGVLFIDRRAWSSWAPAVNELLRWRWLILSVDEDGASAAMTTARAFLHATQRSW